MGSFKIITLGCKVNQYESAYLNEALRREGWKEASKDEIADVSIVNTCIVTQRASDQSRQAIRKAIRENPSGKTAAIGCYAQVFPEEIVAIEGVSLVVGNTAKGQLPDILLNAHKGLLSSSEDGNSPRLPFRKGGGGGIPMQKAECKPSTVHSNFPERMPFQFMPIEVFRDRTRGFLKIQDGCDSFCTYCIVPFARGPVRSLASERVLTAMKALAEKGYREVVLTGIHLGKYGADLDDGASLKELLELLGREELPLRIRLSSIEPKELDKELIEMVASESWLCRHFHIPLQSGDDLILKKMNRNYTGREFRDLVEEIRKKIPLAAIGVDVMAGFPGEDEQGFNNTYAFVKDLPISYLHVFPFSPRKGTPAANFSGQVKKKEIKERAGALRALGQEKRQAFYGSCLGREFEVLAEGWESAKRGWIKGWSDNYVPVTFRATQLMKNVMVPVLLRGLEKNGVVGIVVRHQ